MNTGRSHTEMWKIEGLKQALDKWLDLMSHLAELGGTKKCLVRRNVSFPFVHGNTLGLKGATSRAMVALQRAYRRWREHPCFSTVELTEKTFGNTFTLRESGYRATVLCRAASYCGERDGMLLMVMMNVFRLRKGRFL